MSGSELYKDHPLPEFREHWNIPRDHVCDGKCMCFARGCPCEVCIPITKRVDAMIRDERPAHSEGWNRMEPPAIDEPRRWVLWSYIEQHPGETAPTFRGWAWVKLDMGHSSGPLVALLPVQELRVVRQGEGVRG